MDEAGARAAHQLYDSAAGCERDRATDRDDPLRERSSDQSPRFEKAGALRDSEKQTEDKLERILDERREEREVVVTGDDIMHIVSKWTGVPLNRMGAKKKRRNSSKWRRS